MRKALLRESQLPRVMRSFGLTVLLFFIGVAVAAAPPSPAASAPATGAATPAAAASGAKQLRPLTKKQAAAAAKKSADDKKAATAKKEEEDKAAEAKKKADAERLPLSTLHFDIQCVQLVNPPAFPTLRQWTQDVEKHYPKLAFWRASAFAPEPGASGAAPSASAASGGGEASAASPTTTAASAVAAGASAASSPAPKAPPIICPSVGPNTLVGAGEVLVIVKQEEYAKVLKATDNEAPRLKLNGFDMGKGAELLTVENAPYNMLAVRYQLKAHDDAHTAWGTLYEEFGLTSRANLRVALVWGAAPNPTTVFSPNPDLHPRPLFVAISNRTSITSATVFSLLLLLFFWWAMSKTDIFRSSSALFWWDEAALLKKQIRHSIEAPRARTANPSAYQRPRTGGRMQAWAAAKTQLNAARNQIMAATAAVMRNSRTPPAAGAPVVPPVAAPVVPPVVPVVPAAPAIAPPAPAPLRPEVLKAIQASEHGGPNFDDSMVPRCLYLARAARAQNYPDNDPDMHATVVGLALDPIPWKPHRATFSLSAVQVGVWVMFAAVAGVFLWLVFWQIPALTPQMLGLVTISGLTAAASWLVDPASKAFLKSKNLLSDLVTGTNGDMRVHRFQAVLVNGLLLFVGGFQVVQTLSYPVFDASWLGFLGLSGVLQTAGKKLLDAPETPPP